MWPKKTLLAIAAYCAVITVPGLLPLMYRWHVYEWSNLGEVLDFRPHSRSSQPLAAAEAELRPEASAKSFLAVRIEDPAGSMAFFYDSLWQTEKRQPGAITRVLHYGDSPTTADLITADVRGLLQEQFGDAGHGSYLIAKPWAWYGHVGLEADASGWKIDPANSPESRDGRFGLAGVSFRGDTGASSRVKLRRPGHTRVTVTYLTQSGGGQFRLDADGQDLGVVDTDAPPAAAQRSFALPEGARNVTLRVTRGPVRLFGYSFYKDPPGVMYDSLGLNGAYTRVLSGVFNEQHWAEQLRAANPQLVVINYGTNESVYPKYVYYSMEKELKEAIRRVRTALPKTSVLVMSPMDRGERQPGGIIGTVSVMPQLISLEQRVARESNVAFFNTFEAMGGDGTMGRWYQAEPRLVSADFIHPLPSGARIVGTLFYKALMEGYNRHKLKAIRTQIAQSGR